MASSATVIDSQLERFVRAPKIFAFQDLKPIYCYSLYKELQKTPIEQVQQIVHKSLKAVESQMKDVKTPLIGARDSEVHLHNALTLPQIFSKTCKANTVKEFRAQRNRIDAHWVSRRIGYLSIGVYPFVVNNQVYYDYFLYPGITINLVNRIGSSHLRCLELVGESKELRKTYIKLFIRMSDEQEVLDQIRVDFSYIYNGNRSLQRLHVLASGMKDCVIHPDLKLDDSLTHNTWNITWKAAFELHDSTPLWYLPLIESCLMERFNTFRASKPYNDEKEQLYLEQAEAYDRLESIDVVMLSLIEHNWSDPGSVIKDKSCLFCGDRMTHKSIPMAARGAAGLFAVISSSCLTYLALEKLSPDTVLPDEKVIELLATKVVCRPCYQSTQNPAPKNVPYTPEQRKERYRTIDWVKEHPKEDVHVCDNPVCRAELNSDRLLQNVMPHPEVPWPTEFGRIGMWLCEQCHRDWKATKKLRYVLKKMEPIDYSTWDQWCSCCKKKSRVCTMTGPRCGPCRDKFAEGWFRTAACLYPGDAGYDQDMSNLPPSYRANIDAAPAKVEHSALVLAAANEVRAKILVAKAAEEKALAAGVQGGFEESGGSGDDGGSSVDDEGDDESVAVGEDVEKQPKRKAYKPSLRGRFGNGKTKADAAGVTKAKAKPRRGTRGRRGTKSQARLAAELEKELSNEDYIDSD